MRLIWEDQMEGTDKASYACLNGYCCDSALYYVKGKYDLFAYFGFLLAAIGLINYIIIVSLISFSRLYLGDRLSHGKDERGMGVCMLLAIVLTLCFVAISPSEGPTYNPFRTSPHYPSGQTFKVEKRFNEFDGFFETSDIIVRENREPCMNHCRDLTFRASL